MINIKENRKVPIKRVGRKRPASCQMGSSCSQCRPREASWRSQMKAQRRREAVRNKGREKTEGSSPWHLDIMGRFQGTSFSPFILIFNSGTIFLLARLVPIAVHFQSSDMVTWLSSPSSRLAYWAFPQHLGLLRQSERLGPHWLPERPSTHLSSPPSPGRLGLHLPG